MQSGGATNVQAHGCGVFVMCEVAVRRVKYLHVSRGVEVSRRTRESGRKTSHSINELH